MAASDNIDQLKAIIKVYERHHADCAISTALRESAARELLALTHEPSAPSQPQEQASSTLDSFQTILFEPSSSRTKRRSVNRGPWKKQRPDWKAAADLFLAEAPLAQDWNNKASKLGIKSPTPSGSTCERIGQLVQPRQKGAAIISRAEHHAEQAADLLQQTSISLARTRIYLLHILSYFHVLDSMGLVNRESIVKMMREKMKVNGGNKYLKRIWDGAAWVNKDLMKGLVRAGWTWSQATTLCYFCVPYQPYRYAHINHPDSLVYMLGVLKGQEYIPPSNAVCISHTVPEVVASWEPAVCLLSAREILGYDGANAEQPQKKRKISLLATNDRTTRSPTDTESTLATMENALRQDEDDHISVDFDRGEDSTRSEPLEKHAAGNIQQSTPESAGNSNMIHHFPEADGVEGQGNTVQGSEEAAVIHKSIFRLAVSSNANAFQTSVEANPQAQQLLTPPSQELVQTGQQAPPMAGESGTSQEGRQTAELAPNSPFGASINLAESCDGVRTEFHGCPDRHNEPQQTSHQARDEPTYSSDYLWEHSAATQDTGTYPSDYLSTLENFNWNTLNFEAQFSLEL